MESDAPFCVIDVLIKHDVPFVIIGGHAVLDIFDFVPGHPDEPVEELFGSSHEIGGRRFVSLKWLRRMKQSAGRLKDRLDLDNLPGE